MNFTLTQRTYRTADGEACFEGDPRARFLVGGAGAEIPMAEAEALGLLKAAGTVEDKSEAPAEDKAVSRGRRKAVNDGVSGD